MAVRYALTPSAIPALEMQELLSNAQLPNVANLVNYRKGCKERGRGKEKRDEKRMKKDGEKKNARKRIEKKGWIETTRGLEKMKKGWKGWMKKGEKRTREG